MKSTEFLTEDAMTDIAKTIKIIKAQCQPFLQQADGKFLWRGVKASPTATTIHKDIRLDKRKPVDTPNRLHKKFNDQFVKDFGAPFRNAMFCSGKPSIVEDYGRIYAVFPEGNFKFIWSESIPDLLGEWQNHEPRDNRSESPAEWNARLNSVEDKFVKKYVINNYSNTDLNSAIRSGNEIMIRAVGYYGISRVYLEEYYDEIMELFNEK